MRALVPVLAQAIPLVAGAIAAEPVLLGAVVGAGLVVVGVGLALAVQKLL